MDQSVKSNSKNRYINWIEGTIASFVFQFLKCKSKFSSTGTVLSPLAQGDLTNEISGVIIANIDEIDRRLRLDG